MRPMGQKDNYRFDSCPDYKKIKKRLGLTEKYVYLC